MPVIFKLLYINYYLLYLSLIHCEEVKTILPFPSFREKIEEVSVNMTTSKKPDKSIVTFLVQNVKEIFSSSDEPTILVDQDIEESTTVVDKFINTHSESANNMKFLNVIEKGSNNLLTVTTETTSIMIQELTIKNELLNLSKDLVILQQAEREETEIDSLQSFDSSKTLNKGTKLSSSKQYDSFTNRSCIYCNNVAVENCNDPKNKLIPSIICEQSEDLCYSQHTPFGLVDRGCFNINRNITTYFCSCNLCNYVAISEMPHIFSSKEDWIENVIEMSRTKRLRQSIFKDMSCLRCEVNVTTNSGDILDSANCLEGNIGSLPVQPCTTNEVCAVKAVRSEGYLWRGCVSQPLYNYWWTLCDTDLCNYDALVSPFDKF